MFVVLCRDLCVNHKGHPLLQRNKEELRHPPVEQIKSHTPHTPPYKKKACIKESHGGRAAGESSTADKQHLPSSSSSITPRTLTHPSLLPRESHPAIKTSRTRKTSSRGRPCQNTLRAKGIAIDKRKRPSFPPTKPSHAHAQKWQTPLPPCLPHTPHKTKQKSSKQCNHPDSNPNPQKSPKRMWRSYPPGDTY